MEASKVTLSTETRLMAGLKLAEKQRYLLKKDKVVAYIQSKPPKTLIPIGVLATSAGVYASASQVYLINKLKKDGYITHHKKPNAMYGYWTVGAPTNEKPKTEAPIVAPVAPTTNKHADIAKLAQQYFWETTSDNLHGFITWLSKREK